MSRSIFAAFFILFVSITAASAQSCNAHPNTLTNGTNADASQVMEISITCWDVCGTG